MRPASRQRCLHFVAVVAMMKYVRRDWFRSDGLVWVYGLSVDPVQYVGVLQWQKHEVVGPTSSKAMK